MGSRSASQWVVKPIMCLSDEAHEIIDDPPTHYLGCLEFEKRADYYNKLSDSNEDKVQTELRRIAFIKEVIEKSEASNNIKTLIQHVQASLKGWRTDTSARIRQVERVSPRREPEHHDPNVIRVDIDYDIRSGSFSGQRISVYDLLRDVQSPLLKSKRIPGSSYYHLPSNNMKVR